MNILICVKQVPDTTEIKINPETNTLIRDGVVSIVNPFDAYALEAALRIKDKCEGSKVTVLSMGPEQAKNALRECLSIGADKAYLVSGREFGGSDTLATSYVLSCAIKKLEECEGSFDVIFCGKQAIDGDTAQVGPGIAEHLDFPQITFAVETVLEEDKIRVKRETDSGYEVLRSKLPCVITMSKPAYDPRYPTVKGKLAAKRADIPTITPADLVLDLKQVGLKGSPTKVKKTFVPAVKKTGIKIEGKSSKEAAEFLLEVLSDNNMWGGV